MNTSAPAGQSASTIRPSHDLPGPVRGGPDMGRHDTAGQAGTRTPSRMLIAAAVVLCVVAVAGTVVYLRNRGTWPGDPAAYIPPRLDGDEVGRDEDDSAAVRDLLLDQMGAADADVETAAGTIGTTAGFPDLVLVAVSSPNQAEYMKRLEGDEVDATEIGGVPVVVLEESADAYGFDFATAVARPRDDLMTVCVSIGAKTAEAGRGRALACTKAMLETAR
ncbi:MAG: hypothetical protein IT198_11580 [Acidimicrobiia bacterium]|nr:hypothetical protein [Acidimicrobiia bacterium]